MQVGFAKSVDGVATNLRRLVVRRALENMPTVPFRLENWLKVIWLL